MMCVLRRKTNEQTFFMIKDGGNVWIERMDPKKTNYKRPAVEKPIPIMMERKPITPSFLLLPPVGPGPLPNPPHHHGPSQDSHFADLPS